MIGMWLIVKTLEVGHCVVIILFAAKTYDAKKKGNKDKKKLDSDVDSLYMVSEKMDAVWYSKNYDEETGEFDLFKHNTKDKKKLASESSEPPSEV